MWLKKFFLAFQQYAEHYWPIVTNLLVGLSLSTVYTLRRQTYLHITFPHNLEQIGAQWVLRGNPHVSWGQLNAKISEPTQLLL